MFQIFTNKTFCTTTIFFSNTVLFVGLLYKPPVKYIEICLCSVAQCEKHQSVTIRDIVAQKFSNQALPSLLLICLFKPNYPLYFGIAATMRTATSSVSW